MRILVISDSHGDYPRAFRAHELAAPTDAVVHLGDGAEDARLLEEVLHVPVLRLAGNCDPGSPLPRETLLDFAGARVFATHGDRYSVKGALTRLEERGAAAGAAVILYGHTHRPLVLDRGGLLLVNPGALSGPAGSYAILTLGSEPPRAEIFHLP